MITKFIIIAIFLSLMSCSLFVRDHSLQFVGQLKFKKSGEIGRYDRKREDDSTQTLYTNFKYGSEVRPVMIYAQGSGCDSLIKKNKDGTIRAKGISQPLQQLSNKYWIFAFEKRGVNTFDPRPKNGTKSCSKTYHQHSSLEYRTKEYIDLLKWLQSLKEVDQKKIVIVGFSEGTDVVARIGANSKIPTHMGYFSGGGYTQMYDFLVMTRHYWNKNLKGDSVKVNQKVEKLMLSFRDIMKNPKADKYFLGHPYSRWYSYFRNEPYKELLKFDRPIFAASGGSDESVPIESPDYIEVQFILNGKDNLTFKRYPELTHGLYKCRPDKDKNCNWEESYKFPEIFREFVRWIDKN